MKYLVIASHPDDEILGCGGSMAKWSREGNEVHILILAEGVTSRDKNRNREYRKDEISMLTQAAKRAADILNVKSLKLFNYPDNRMDSLDLLDVVKFIENNIEKLKPDAVVTHHIGDLNIDHQKTHQAVITACRPHLVQTVKRILSFEVPSATEWQSPTLGAPFVPNWFEDISATIELKLKALNAYESEMREWPHARSIEAVEYLARWRGASMGLKAAEAFSLIRQLR